MQTRVRALVLVRYNAIAAGMIGQGVADRDRLAVRDGAIFRSNFNAICPVQSRAQKYSAFHPTQISGYLRAVPSRQEGRIAIVTNARRDAVDARASARKVVAG